MKRTAVVLFALSVVTPALAQVTRTDLVIADLKYSQSRNILYAAVESSSPHAPNSILLLDPVTGHDRGQIAAGNDPKIIALSDDEQYLYVWLAGDVLIKRFNLSTQQSDLEFPAALTGAPSGSIVASMLVVQGDPDSVVIFFKQTCCTPADAGAGVFHNSQQLPDIVAPTSIGCTSATYSASPKALWCQDSVSSSFGIFQLQLDGMGIHVVAVKGLSGPDFNQTPIFFQNVLYFNSYGMVADPVQKILLAQPSFVGASVGGFAVDANAGVIYYSRATADDDQIWVVGMDAQRFTQVAFGYVKNLLSTMVRCGAGGFAGINESSGLSIIPLSAVPFLPAVQPASPTTDSSGIRRLAIPNGCGFCPNQFVYHSGSNRFFVGVPDGVPGLGNSIIPIDGSSLTAQAPLWVGSQPASLTLTPDGQHLLVTMNGSNVVRRVNLSSFETDLNTFVYGPYGPILANSVASLSPSGDNIAVAQAIKDSSGGFEVFAASIATYAQGALTGAVDSQGAIVLTENTAGTALYGIVAATPNGGEALLRVPLPLPAASPVLSSGVPLLSYLSCQGDTCVSSFGTMFDLARDRILGVCPVNGSPLLDLTNQRAYFLSGTAQSGQIASCDLNRFLPAELINFRDPVGAYNSLIFTTPDQFVFNTGSEIVEMPKSLLRPLPPTPIPAPVSGSGQVTLALGSHQGVYDPLRAVLYVVLTPAPATTFSILSTVPLANCIGVISPKTGALKSQIPVPGQPAMVAISSDSAYLYVALSYSNTVVQVDLASGKVVQTILLNSSVSAMAAVPGETGSIAIADATTLHIFDNGVERPGSYTPASGLGITSLVFGSTSGQLYSVAGSTLAAWQVGPSGVTRQSQVGVPLAQSLSRIGNRLFTDYGWIFDTGTLAHIDTISNVTSLTADAVSNRIYGYSNGSGLIPLGLSVFDATNETLLSNLPGGGQGPLIPCGVQRLAILGSTRIAIDTIGHSSLPHLPSSYPPDPNGVARLALAANSIAWDASSNRVLIALSAAVGPDGNSLVSFDPATGKLYPVGRSGNQPGPISIAPDAHVAYVGQTGPMLITRVNLDSGATERRWSVPPTAQIEQFPVPTQLFAIAAATDSLALTAGPVLPPPYPWVLMAMDKGIARPDIVGVSPNFLLSEVDAATADRKELFTGYPQVSAWAVTPNGIESQPFPALKGLRDWGKAASCSANLYLNSGQVINQAGQLVADFGASISYSPSTTVACDSTSDRLLFLSSVTDGFNLFAFRLSTGASIGFLRFGNVKGNPADLLVAGPSYAAVRTDQGMVVLLALDQLLPSLPVPSISAVSNAASYSQNGFAPGSIITIVGSGLASWTQTATSYPIPTTMGDATVLVGSQNAYLLYVSDTQINAILSFYLQTGSAPLTLTVPGGSATVTIPIVSVSPGIFTSDGEHAQAENQDYSVNSSANPAPSGSTISVYFTGQGAVKTALADGYPAPSAGILNYATVNPATASVGGQTAVVSYAGLAPGFAGVAQANITLPNLSTGDYPLIITVGGATSNSAIISVK